jgi:nickel-dependent lactate racemase
MQVEIKYGDESLRLELPDERAGGVWNLARVAGRLAGGGPRGDAALAVAVEELRRAGLSEAVAGGELGLLVADGTREWSPEALLPPLLELAAGARRVRAFLCTGTHDSGSPENAALARRIEAVLGRAPVAAELVVHECRTARFLSRGTTARGTRVEVNELARGCDAFLAVADMKYHYFAGYSNAVKYVVPGIASMETARGNHSLALEPESTFGRHPWHPDPLRRSNPLAEDMLEAHGLVLERRPHFALVLVTSKEGILWAGGGASAEVSARGMQVVDRVAGLELEPVRFLVVSPGGHPHDESLYTAQRALELSRAAVRDGGEVLFLARCRNGVGPPKARENFFEPLKRPLEEVRELPRERYVMYAHKPVKFARYLEGLAAVHLLSEMPPDEVAAVHLRPAESAQAVIDGWVERAGPGDRIGFLDDASKFAVWGRG